MTFRKLAPIACSLSLLMASASPPTVDAFQPVSPVTRSRQGAACQPLHVSVVSQFVGTKSAKKEELDEKIRSTFEKETPESVGMKDAGIRQPVRPKKNARKQKSKRKHNYKSNAAFLNESPDLAFFSLHSSAVSHLHHDMPIEDIVRAIKRSQNRHDVHDLRTIAAFLIDECDENWGYGYRGSLLSRLAVAALHLKDIDTARRAIETRRVYERPSMQPYESAAIVRGLMRTENIEEGWAVLEDELRLPLDGTSLDASFNRELLKHRARSLASIATRHFFEGEPYVAAKAMDKIRELGDLIGNAGLHNEVEMPWTRLVNAAAQCSDASMPGGSFSCKFIDDGISLPSDLTQLVWDAMVSFPCPGAEDECSIDDYLLEP